MKKKYHGRTKLANRKKSQRPAKKKSQRRLSARSRTPFRREVDRRFMETAISEMLLSRSEHTNKTDPSVGAVLVNRRGKEIARAHRGKYSAGEHGEFTILEKAAPNKDPKGGTLYVTLEPCSKRQPPKRPCAHRIAEKRVSRVVIGIPDPNPDIHGRGIAYLQDHGVKVDFFDHDLTKRIEQANREFIEFYEKKPEKSGTITDVFTGPAYEENRPISDATKDDLSEEAIRKYLVARRLRYRIPSGQLWDFLGKAGFVVEDSDRMLRPTLAGLVLFGKTPDLFEPQCKIKADCFSGPPEGGTSIERLIDQEDISGPLSVVLDTLKKFFDKHVRRVPRIRGSKRVRGPEFPWTVIREAIVNALVHRDYRRGAHVTFQMFSDRIIVKSPGYPVPPLTLAMIRSYNVVSLKRNPRVADSAYQLGYMEERGSGIPSMPMRLNEYGLREPDFDYDKGFFAVTLYGRELTPVQIRTSRTVLTQLSPRQRQLLDIIDQHSRITSGEWAARTGISKETANQDFKGLVDLQLIVRMGKGRSTYYVLTRP